MSEQPYIMGIDQGSSGSRALILDREGQVHGYGYHILASLFPRPGWVELDPTTVLESVQAAIADALDDAKISPAELAGCGIACQRNTEYVWHAKTGDPLANAMSWQDMRTSPLVDELADSDLLPEARYRLGYAPGTYSTAMHLAWRVRHDQAVANAARNGHLRTGLTASWLLKSGGNAAGHNLDYSLTQAMGVFDFRTGDYWAEWLHYLNLPREAFPTVRPTLYEYGTLAMRDKQGREADVPVVAIIGNEQAALFGHGCRISPGQAECTHGTASFVDVYLGQSAPEQDNLNIYYAWHLGDVPTYCIEADTTVSGAVLRWMRHQVGLLDTEAEVNALASSVADSAGVIFVPAFTGLNVPYNDPNVRGTILGLSLGTNRAHIARAFLEALAFQIRAIHKTMQAEAGLQIEQLNMGGGIANSDTACQLIADQIGIPVLRPTFAETTVHGITLLAGLGADVWSSVDDLPPLPGGHETFDPSLDDETRNAAFERWNHAINCLMAMNKVD